MTTIAIVGPTASGKSALALALARRHPGTELVSVDSMQVYRGMDVGTAKPSAAERAEVPHHGIDLADPSEEVTVVRYQAEARAALTEIEHRNGRAVLVGGTGLYLRALVDRLDPPGEWPATRAELELDPDTAHLHARLAALDPVAAARMQPTNRRRVLRALEVTLGSGQAFSSFGPGLESYPASEVVQVGLRWPRAELTARIEQRFARQLDDGFLAEVEELASRPAGLSRTARQALGYRELLDHLTGRTSLDEAVHLAITRTRQFAVRQDRWFRRDPRIRWLEATDDPIAALDLIEQELASCA